MICDIELLRFCEAIVYQREINLQFERKDEVRFEHMIGLAKRAYLRLTEDK